ncbi:MAG: DNA translocase FtsK [Erysipelotrichaceae bacterium]|nr:DNA translocase FtsK [Erysipelotrichaceae bacterium]
MGALLLSSIILLFSMDEDHSIGDTFSRIFSAPDDYEDDYEDEEEEEIIQTAKPKKTPLQVPVDPVPTPLNHKKGSKSSIFMSADNQGGSTTASSSLSNIKAPVRFDTLEAPASTSISDVPVTGVVYEEVEEPVAVQEKPKEVVQAKPALKERKRGYVHMEENDDIDVTTIERPVLKEPVIIKTDIPVQKEDYPVISEPRNQLSFEIQQPVYEEKPVVEQRPVVESKPVAEKPKEAAKPKKQEPVKPAEPVFKEEPKVMVMGEEVIIEKPYELPSMELLDVPAARKSNTNLLSAREKGVRLISILDTFGIKAELKEIKIGPAVTQFEIKPDVNVKINRILSISDNIKMELAAKDIRIEAPIPGKPAVGIEIPNEEKTMVKMRELMEAEPADQKNNKMLFALGKDLSGKPVFCRLNKMPHLLIAGATGSGKSVCMNTIITSFLMRTSPDEVKLLLVDPKKVEFTPYQSIPHLIGPVISDPNKASNALKVIVNEMDQRYEIFSHVGVRNIEVYNEKVKEDPTEDQLQPLPYIVVIIDELADLMAVAGKEVEISIQRITQLARAAGIHLIVATQRPSTDVITGVIKANIPSRIAFSVSSSIDSRTILDHVGAEKLLGNGDMLYMPMGENSPIRVQGAYVSDDEVQKVADACSKQRKPKYVDAFVRLEGVSGNENTAVCSVDEDPMFAEVKDYVIEVQRASTSLLQRRFGIGYNRAARYIDMLEEKGVIGPQQGSKPREVYINKEDSDE